MNDMTYKTKGEVLAALNVFKSIGMEPPASLLQQLKDFEDAENAEKLIKNSATPIWDTLQANYPYGVMPAEKKKAVEDTVAQLLEEGPHAEEPGLLMGKIQCGKTDTFEDIIGLAFDKGVDIAIVITKGTKALVNQTIKRMKHDYRFFKPSDRLDQATTIDVKDIMNLKGGLKKAQVESMKIVIVCKKNARNLDLLIELFESKSDFLKKKKVLIVDDEADFASRNYQSIKPEALVDDDGNPILQDRQYKMAKISDQIDEFRKIPAFCRYLQVTATPYCLYLQPDGELNLNGKFVKPFKPRFTTLVPVHDKYIGGQEYYVEAMNPDSMYSHLYHPIEQKCIDVMGHEDKRYLNNAVASGNIYGLTYALIAFFMSTATRRIQEKNQPVPKDYKASAVFHVEIDKKNHAWQKRVIDRLIEDIKAAIVDEDQSDQRILSAINIIYEDFVQSNKKGKAEGLISVDMPSKEDILDEIRVIFSPALHNYVVQPVNSDEEMAELLDEDSGELKLETAANIFIGGNILDRGVTIKNMLCFFYGRDPKGFQQDTVLQHARMYGARSKEDMAVTRFHTTQHLYKILVRMNELDNQLREWFIEGKDKEEPNAVFVGFDKEIRPCAMQKIKVSNALTIKKQKTMYPIGFWTGGKTAIGKTILEIDKLITEAPGYAGDDGDAFFEMDKDVVFEILKKIESTYVYDAKFFNEDYKSDIREMMCGLQYCLDKSGGKVLVLHRTDRNMNRIRENGGFMDAPMDGRTDLKPSREVAIDKPVLMLLRQNGKKNIDANGQNIGWNDTPFYWPVLLTQEEIDPVMFAIEQRKAGQIAVIGASDILEGIDPADVLKLTFKGDLEQYFGKEGETPDKEESRSVKETTASRLIKKDEDGNWLINPAVNFDKEHDHGLYSLNNGVFPFVVRPYKYMLLCNGLDARADLMLLQLSDPALWEYLPDAHFREDGALLDRDTLHHKVPDVLMHAQDTIIDKNMETHEEMDETVTQWVIVYHIVKVLKSRKNTIDWEKVFSDEEAPTE